MVPKLTRFGAGLTDPSDDVKAGITGEKNTTVSSSASSCIFFGVLGAHPIFRLKGQTSTANLKLKRKSVQVILVKLLWS